MIKYASSHLHKYVGDVKQKDNFQNNLAVNKPERNYFYAHPEQIMKNMPRIASKIGATLKGKNLLPEGANSFL